MRLLSHRSRANAVVSDLGGHRSDLAGPRARRVRPGYNGAPMPARRRLFACLAATLALVGRAAAADEDTPPGPHDPLAGFAGERAFVRTPSNEIVLFPSL